MRGKATIAAIALAVLALGSSASAQGPGDPFDKVTGGGQVIINNNFQGAGDTIAFTARELTPSGPAARGQVEYLPTASQSGPIISAGRWHGSVNCLVVDSDQTATFAGRKTQGNDLPFFRISVVDNGPEGGGNQGEDLIFLEESEDPLDCEDDADADEQTLARGNLTVHNAAEPS